MIIGKIFENGEVVMKRKFETPLDAVKVITYFGEILKINMSFTIMEKR